MKQGARCLFLLVLLVAHIAPSSNSGSFSYLRSFFPSFRSSPAVVAKATRDLLNATSTVVPPTTLTDFDALQPLADGTYLFNGTTIVEPTPPSGIGASEFATEWEKLDLELTDDEDLEPAHNISNYIPNDQISALANTAVGGSSDNKTMEVLISNDKTLAYMRFDRSGRELIKCTLYDIENHAWRHKDDVYLRSHNLKPVAADYGMMLEAVRQCSHLATKQLKSLLGNRTINEMESKGSNSNKLATGSVGGASGDVAAAGEKGWWDLISTSVNKTTSTKADGMAMWKGIIPGTKWCGLGDMATDYDDLGSKVDLDICCRAHDHCPIRLKAFRVGYGLMNFSFYTKSHCDCDVDFYRCLKRSRNSQAGTLGNFYFNVLKVYCIKNDGEKRCLQKRKTGKRVEECETSTGTKSEKMKFVPFHYTFQKKR